MKRRRLQTNHRVERQIKRVSTDSNISEELREKRIEDIKWWGDWVLSIGEGKNPSPIHIPKKIQLPDANASINDLIDWVFPDTACLTNKDTLKGRAILALRNETIDHINKLITERVPVTSPDQQKTYFSTDW